MKAEDIIRYKEAAMGEIEVGDTVWVSKWNIRGKVTKIKKYSDTWSVYTIESEDGNAGLFSLRAIKKVPKDR